MGKKLEQFLSTARDKAQSVAPDGYDVDRLIGMARQIVSSNSDLRQDASGESLIDSIMRCAGSGLYLHGDEAYLVARWDKNRKCKAVNFEPGYRGLIRLATMHPDVESVTATLVYEADDFSATGGDSPSISHRYNPFDENRGKVIGVYASAQFASGRMVHEPLSRAEIDKIRSNAGTDYIWRDHYGPMARKSAIRALTKYLPRTEASSLAIGYASEPYASDTDAATEKADVTAIPGAAPEQSAPAPSKADKAIERVRERLPERLHPVAIAMIEHAGDELDAVLGRVALLAGDDAPGILRAAAFPATVDACAAAGCEDALIAIVVDAAQIDTDTATEAMRIVATTGAPAADAIQQAKTAGNKEES